MLDNHYTAKKKHKNSYENKQWQIWALYMLYTMKPETEKWQDLNAEKCLKTGIPA